MNEEEFAVLSAGHALNALSPEDERAYISALLEHPEWHEIAAADAATAAALAGGVAQIAPPLGSRGALLSLIARTPQAPPRPPSPAVDTSGEPADAVSDHVDEVEAGSDLSVLEPALPAETAPPVPSDSETVGEPSHPPPTDVVQTVARRRWLRGLFALAASLAVLVTLGFGAALIGQQLNRSPASLALERIENAPDAQSAVVAAEGGGEATAHWSESLGEVVLVTAGLPALPSGQTYQLWFVRDGGTIESAGLFGTDADGQSTSLLNGTVEPGDAFAVSVEPGGGSAQPTTDPIIVIPSAT